MYVPRRFFFGFLYYLKECFLCFNIKSSLATTQRENGGPIEPLRVSRLKHRHWRLNRRLRHSTQNVTRVHLILWYSCFIRVSSNGQHTAPTIFPPSENAPFFSLNYKSRLNVINNSIGYVYCFYYSSFNGWPM